MLKNELKISYLIQD